MDIQPIKISSKVINSNQFIHGPNQFIQDMGPLAFEGQFDLTAYLNEYLIQFSSSNNPLIGNFLNVTPANTTGILNTNTILQSILVPANTFQTGDLIDLTARWTKAGTNNTWVGRVYVNTSISITGAQQVFPFTFANINTFGQAIRTLNVINELTNTQVFSNTTSSSTDIAGGLFATLLLDWTSDQYIFTTASLSGGGGIASDIVSSNFLMLKRNRP